jgi:hypothetical protein
MKQGRDGQKDKCNTEWADVCLKKWKKQCES